MGITNTSIQFHTVNVSRYNNAEAYMFDPDNQPIALNLSEAVLSGDPTSSTSLRNQAFLGWASNGDITGNLLYVNYAHRSDFIALQNLSLNLSGAIGIARYGGGMFRGVKADQADQFGLLGLILYSDPKDDGFRQGPVFPNGPWLPSTGYQRGSVRFTFKCPGNVDPDRLRERCDMNTSQVRPSIPLIAMSYGNAQLLMQDMAGFSVETTPSLDGWQGGMEFVYKTGINDDNNPNVTKVNLIIENSEIEAEISNIFGFIPGSKFVDETILIGGHRDAWVFGAADPISGQTCILEIARAFGKLLQDGYVPKRNLMFASWDAEEQSLIGSVIFTEVNEIMVESQIVSYFNMDITVAGEYFYIDTDPLIATLVLEQMKKVPQPYAVNEDDTLYSVWKERVFPDDDDDHVYTGILGSGSDFVPFYHHYGISGITGGIAGTYGTYHSVYDSFVYMEIVDEEWERARAMAQLYGLIAFEMIDNDIIPFDVVNLYNSMVRWIGDLPSWASDNECEFDADLLEPLLDIVTLFGNVANRFNDNVEDLRNNVDRGSYEEDVKECNDALKKLTKQFLIEDGLPERKYYKNVLVAPNILSGYSAYPFPYIVYAFQFDCSDGYINETVFKTIEIIQSATDFLDSYL